jgi:hypothetical protein
VGVDDDAAGVGELDQLAELLRDLCFRPRLLYVRFVGGETALASVYLCRPGRTAPAGATDRAVRSAPWR